MIYNDFDLWILERSGDHYPLRAESHANARGKLTLDLSSPRFAASLKKLEEEVTDRKFAKKFGEDLFRRLFKGDIGTLYSQSLGRVIGNDYAGVRIRLRIEAPELAAVPWELLYDGQFFLATSTKTPLTRYLELLTPIEALKSTLPIKILIVIPEGSGLDTTGETHGVIRAINELEGAVDCHVLDKNVTRQAIRDKLRENYDIFHFIGHGSFDEDDDGSLELNSETGETRLIKAESFALFFQNYPATKLVILNSCEGAQISATKPLGGMAPQIINAGVAAVIAMQYEIPDMVAKLFAREFYEALCTGINRGRVDAAVAEARLSICQEFDEGNDFALPVLFMRSPNGVIFDLQEQQASITSASEAHTAVEVDKAYAHNIQAREVQKQSAEPQAVALIDQRQQEDTENAQLIKTKIRQWRKRVITTSILAALVIIAAVWSRFLAIPNLDDYLQRKFVTSIMDPRIEKPFANDLRLIMVKEGGEGIFRLDLSDARHGTKLRKNFAKLIRDLADGPTAEVPNDGARVVALDYYFISVNEEADQSLVDAINYAREQGTSVVVGIRAAPEHADDKMPENLRNALRDSMGDVDNLRPHLETPLMRAAVLGRLSNESAAGCAEGEVAVLPSFPLMVLMRAGAPAQSETLCSVDERRQPQQWTPPIKACLDTDEYELNLRGAGNSSAAVGPLVRQVPVDKEYLSSQEPTEMFTYIDLTPSNNLTEMTRSIEEIYIPTADDQSRIENWKLSDPQQYQGKIVIVGVQRTFTGECPGSPQNDKDVWCVSDSEGGERKGQRYGPEIQANILSNLLTCVYIRVLPIGWSILIVVMMVALGALLRIRFKQWLRWKLPFKLPLFEKPLEIPLLILIIAIVYLIIAFVAYKQWRLLFGDLHYHVVALFVAYWLVGLTRKRLGMR